MTIPRAVSLDDPQGAQPPAHLHSANPHGAHPHDIAPASAGAVLLAGAASPLWWSAKQRLACAAALVALLWLVIAWATA